jgi:hypothetical protein
MDAAGKYLVAIERRKQIVLTAHVGDNGRVDSISYRPSRYLACQKIASLAKSKDEAVTRALLATALVAGIQSYTSYSHSYVYDSYGNFGYAVTRDYGWAGDRAADALNVVFQGNTSSAQLQSAWQSMNCW